MILSCFLIARENTAVGSLLHWTTVSSSLESCCCAAYLEKILKFLGNGIFPSYSNAAVAQDQELVCDTLYHSHVNVLLGVISAPSNV